MSKTQKYLWGGVSAEERGDGDHLQWCCVAGGSACPFSGCPLGWPGPPRDPARARGWPRRQAACGGLCLPGPARGSEPPLLPDLAFHRTAVRLAALHCLSPESPAPPRLAASVPQGPSCHKADGQPQPQRTGERRHRGDRGQPEPRLSHAEGAEEAFGPRPISVPPSPAPSSLSSRWDGGARSGAQWGPRHGCLVTQLTVPWQLRPGRRGPPCSHHRSRVAGQGPRELSPNHHGASAANAERGDSAPPLTGSPRCGGAWGASSRQWGAKERAARKGHALRSVESPRCPRRCVRGGSLGKWGSPLKPLSVEPGRLKCAGSGTPSSPPLPCPEL